MKIGIAADHGGYELKEKLTKYLSDKGYSIINYGTNSFDSVDYPDFAFKLGEAVAKQECTYGIAICTTGIGMSIACNKVKGIRCAKVENMDEAIQSRQHVNCNIIAISARIGLEEVEKLVEAFITTDFSNIDRHIKRIEKITKYENGEKNNEY